MLNKPIYINGAAAISIQEPLNETVIYNPLNYSQVHVRCINPVFKEHLNPIAARRMSLIIKRAIITARYAVKMAEIEKPDAIITGTGLGCVQDTEKFLEAMIRNKEKFLQPAFFIQSTHNTISSQIAIDLKCKAYNNTYIHRGVSFENALVDALLQLNKPKIDSALVTGNDEMTPAYFKLLQRLNYWKNSVDSSLNIVDSENSIGSFAGEGSVSLVLSKNKIKNSFATINDIKLHYNPNGIDEKFIVDFLLKNGLNTDDVSLFITGANGDFNNDLVYKKLDNLFDNNRIGHYKNICGEFYTAPAFGLYAAAICLKNNTVPKTMMLSNNNLNNINNILFYNHFQNRDHSLILLSKCIN
ncbi:MAG TPA: beta-ketoacyl synthase chain length factor [Bacteroidales bacterium]|nr:beta-ketoacyl synthase chain length factor [Bacteroidales bacterium]